MAFDKETNPSRSITRILCFLIISAVGINILWNNISYQYISTRIVAMSTFKISKNDLFSLGATKPSFLRSKHNLKSIRQFPIQKTVNKGNSWKDHLELGRTPGKEEVKGSYNSTLEEQIACQKKKSPVCREFQRRKLCDEIMEYYRILDNETKDSYVNLHRYGYHLDSTACSHRPDVVILVHSKFNNFDKRAQIRNTWAANRTIQGVTFATVFFLGEPSMREIRPSQRTRKGNATQENERRDQLGEEVNAITKHIYEEASTFRDIVMGNFTDGYRNLTIKHIMALTWAVSRCPQVGFIAKVDDDVLVNTNSIARYLRGDSCSHSGLLVCTVPHRQKPIRRENSKWFINETDYPFPVFPTWCAGLGELMSRDVAVKLLSTSRDLRAFWIDDVYVTGFLRHKAGLGLADMSSRTDTRSFFTHSRKENVTLLWERLVRTNTHIVA